MAGKDLGVTWSFRGTVPGLMTKMTQDDRAFGEAVYSRPAVGGE